MYQPPPVPPVPADPNIWGVVRSNTSMHGLAGKIYYLSKELTTFGREKGKIIHDVIIPFKLKVITRKVSVFYIKLHLSLFLSLSPLSFAVFSLEKYKCIGNLYCNRYNVNFLKTNATIFGLKNLLLILALLRILHIWLLVSLRLMLPPL